MSDFEFAFSLYGLVLGLSVTEIIGGFARVLGARTSIRLGWLTPALGLLLLVDLTSFWSSAWQLRDSIPVSFGTLLFGIVIAGIYYLAARLVFPETLSDWRDLDDYFMTHKRQVIAGVVTANLMLFAAHLALGDVMTVDGFVTAGIFVGLGLAFAMTRRKWLAGTIIAVILSLYLLLPLVATVIF